MNKLQNLLHNGRSKNKSMAGKQRPKQVDLPDSNFASVIISHSEDSLDVTDEAFRRTMPMPAVSEGTEPQVEVKDGKSPTAFVINDYFEDQMKVDTADSTQARATDVSQEFKKNVYYVSPVPLPPKALAEIKRLKTLNPKQRQKEEKREKKRAKKAGANGSDNTGTPQSPSQVRPESYNEVEIDDDSMEDEKPRAYAMTFTSQEEMMSDSNLNSGIPNSFMSGDNSINFNHLLAQSISSSQPGAANSSLPNATLSKRKGEDTGNSLTGTPEDDAMFKDPSSIFFFDFLSDKQKEGQTAKSLEKKDDNNAAIEKACIQVMDPSDPAEKSNASAKDGHESGSPYDIPLNMHLDFLSGKDEDDYKSKSFKMDRKDLPQVIKLPEGYSPPENFFDQIRRGARSRGQPMGTLSSTEVFENIKKQNLQAFFSGNQIQIRGFEKQEEAVALLSKIFENKIVPSWVTDQIKSNHEIIMCLKSKSDCGTVKKLLTELNIKTCQSSSCAHTSKTLEKIPETEQEDDLKKPHNSFFNQFRESESDADEKEDPDPTKKSTTPSQAHQEFLEAMGGNLQDSESILSTPQYSVARMEESEKDYNSEAGLRNGIRSIRSAIWTSSSIQGDHSHHGSHQRPESCNNCHTRWKVIEQRPQLNPDVQAGAKASAKKLEENSVLSGEIPHYRKAREPPGQARRPARPNREGRESDSAGVVKKQSGFISAVSDKPLVQGVTDTKGSKQETSNEPQTHEAQDGDADDQSKVRFGGYSSLASHVWSIPHTNGKHALPTLSYIQKSKVAQSDKKTDEQTESKETPSSSTLLSYIRQDNSCLPFDQLQQQLIKQQLDPNQILETQPVPTLENESHLVQLSYWQQMLAHNERVETQENGRKTSFDVMTTEKSQNLDKSQFPADIMQQMQQPGPSSLVSLGITEYGQQSYFQQPTMFTQQANGQAPNPQQQPQPNYPMMQHYRGNQQVQSGLPDGNQYGRRPEAERGYEQQPVRQPSFVVNELADQQQQQQVLAQQQAQFNLQAFANSKNYMDQAIQHQQQFLPQQPPQQQSIFYPAQQQPQKRSLEPEVPDPTQLADLMKGVNLSSIPESDVKSEQQPLLMNKPVKSVKSALSLLSNNSDKKSKISMSSRSSTRSGNKKKIRKKVLIGPKNNKINFYRILNSNETNDDEVLSLTTLMIKNIPIRFQQNDMLKLLNRNYTGKYDYFYLPMDLKTQCSVGFAFINFVDPWYILDFYLEFHCMKWSEAIPNCNSTKYVEIVYANMQGIDEIKKELLDKNIMKKNDSHIKPIILDDIQVDPQDIDDIITRYTTNDKFIAEYTERLKKFNALEEQIKEQKAARQQQQQQAQKNKKAKKGAKEDEAKGKDQKEGDAKDSTSKEPKAKPADSKAKDEKKPRTAEQPGEATSSNPSAQSTPNQSAQNAPSPSYGFPQQQFGQGLPASQNPRQAMFGANPMIQKNNYVAPPAQSANFNNVFPTFSQQMPYLADAPNPQPAHVHGFAPPQQQQQQWGYPQNQAFQPAQGYNAGGPGFQGGQRAWAGGRPQQPGQGHSWYPSSQGGGRFSGGGYYPTGQQ